MEIPLCEWQNYCSLSKEIGVSPATVQRAVTSVSLFDTTDIFNDIPDQVEIDEEWFYITWVSQSYSVIPGVKLPA